MEGLGLGSGGGEQAALGERLLVAEADVAIVAAHGGAGGHDGKADGGIVPEAEAADIPVRGGGEEDGGLRGGVVSNGLGAQVREIGGIDEARAGFRGERVEKAPGSDEAGEQGG